MEFPSIGKQCFVGDCKQLDFLPVICELCKDVFCKDHYLSDLHKCSKNEDKVRQCHIALTKNKTVSYVCTAESCSATFPMEMQCPKCKKHYCVQHRYHGCLEITNDERKVKLKKWQIVGKQFAEAKAAVDQEVSYNLKKSKNTAMANKVHLMRVKGSASGPKNIPTDERCYFLVFPPNDTTNEHIKPSKAVYVNMNWTVGRAIDSIADSLKIFNKNNAGCTPKLQLYHHSSGELICNELSVPLTKLFESSQLIDGQRIIIEHATESADSVDTSLYK